MSNEARRSLYRAQNRSVLGCLLWLVLFSIAIAAAVIVAGSIGIF